VSVNLTAKDYCKCVKLRHYALVTFGYLQQRYYKY